jgi:hypothetical protein
MAKAPDREDALRRNRIVLTDFVAQDEAAFLVIGA